jgi:hypothetical protein
VARARERLERLEKRAAPVEDPGAQEQRMRIFLLHKEIGNCRRVAEGKEPIPLTSEEEEFEREEARRFIHEGGLETYRNSSGWQTPEAQALLDEWERSNKAKLQEG